MPIRSRLLLLIFALLNFGWALSDCLILSPGGSPAQPQKTSGEPAGPTMWMDPYSNLVYKEDFETTNAAGYDFYAATTNWTVPNTGSTWVENITSWGRTNHWADFDGIDDYVSITNNPSGTASRYFPRPWTNLTMMCWARADLWREGGGILAQGVTGYDFCALYQATSTANGGATSLWAGVVNYGAAPDAGHFVQSLGLWTTGVWHHVAITWAAVSNLNIYIDGILDVDSRSILDVGGPPYILGGSPLTIGADPRDVANRSSDGQIDSVRCYPFILSPSEIVERMTNTCPAENYTINGQACNPYGNVEYRP